MWKTILKYAAKLIVYVAENPEQIDTAIEVARKLKAAKQKD